MKIRIEWLYDEFECETCGFSDAQGASVWFDGEQLLLLEPVAHCYGGQTFTEEDVYNSILEKLGHEVVIENS